MRSVVHVLPHRGEGAETYLDVLAAMEGFEQRRVALTTDRSPVAAAVEVARQVPAVARATRRADLTHVHGDMASVLCLPLLRWRRSVWTTHGLHLLRRTEGPRRRAVAAALRAVVRAADRTICVTEAERAELVALLPERLRGKVVTVRNGIPLPPAIEATERERSRAELGVDDGVAAFVYVGQLEERKDPLVAVRAAVAARARGAPVALLVAGDGPLAGAVAAEGGDAARLLGRRDDVEGLLAAADAFVLPSRREGLSYALLEAMGRGLPVIAADVPGTAEAVGAAGILLPPGDVEAFAGAFARLTDEPAERTRLGELARSRVAESFGADGMVAGTRALYDEVLAGR